MMVVEVEGEALVDDVEEGTSWRFAARRTRCWREEDSNGMRQISLWISLSLSLAKYLSVCKRRCACLVFGYAEEDS